MRADCNVHATTSDMCDSEDYVVFLINRGNVTNKCRMSGRKEVLEE
jgi:hypothetical protein